MVTSVNSLNIDTKVPERLDLKPNVPELGHEQLNAILDTERIYCCARNMYTLPSLSKKNEKF